MASPAHRVLPAAVPPQPPPIARESFRTFVAHITDFVSNNLPRWRAWPEFANRGAFSRPESISDAVQRLRRNYTYFKVNYLCVVMTALGFSLLAHPLSLLLLVGLFAAWLFLYLLRPPDQPLSLLGRTFPDGEILSALVASTVLVLFLTSIGSLLTSGLMVGCALVCAHGAFRTTNDLFLEESDLAAAAGFATHLGGAAPKVYTSGADPVVYTV